MFDGEGWIGDKFSSRVTFIKASECDFNKDHFNRELQMGNEDKIATSDIQETYMRFIPSYSHYYETNGYWTACEPGRGATLYYYAETGYKGDD